jgi:Leucine-rich repeat (LRR) protein
LKPIKEQQHEKSLKYKRMKKHYLLFLILSFTGHSQTITFPDANFKSILLTSSTSNNIAKNAAGNSIKIDANNNGQIEQSEALLVYKLFYTNPTNGTPPPRLSTQMQASIVTDVTGIAAFTNLNYLNVSINQPTVVSFHLASLNVSSNVLLKELNCFGNQLSLSSINLTGLTQLETLNINYNQFATFSTAGLPALKNLYCTNNLMTSLNFSGSSNLETLSISYNQFASFSTTGLNALKNLYCRTNQLTSLTVNNSQALEILDCQLNQLSTLNLSNLTKLKNLNCNSNQLTTLNMGTNISLQYLNCNSNVISSLHLNASGTLQELYCVINTISSLNLNNYTALVYLSCDNNPMTSLLFANNTLLKYVWCSANNLMTLDLSQTAVKQLYCNNNPNLSYINIKNNVNSPLTFSQDIAPPQNSFNLANLPSLTQICCDAAEVSVLQTVTNNQSDISIGNFCSSSSIVTLRLFIQGYYDSAIHGMRSVKTNQGLTAKIADVDAVTVELRQANGQLIASTATLLKTTGMLSCAFSSAPSGSFYIVVKNRNFIETWTATSQTIGATPLVYDFTTSVSKAYGSNMKLLENGVYGLYSGDINQDGFIEGSDYDQLNTDTKDSAIGFNSTDLNGDGFVDALDYDAINSNVAGSIGSLHP